MEYSNMKAFVKLGKFYFFVCVWTLVSFLKTTKSIFQARVFNKQMMKIY